MVIVENDLIGVVVKSFCRSDKDSELNYDIYVRMYNNIKNYPENQVERYMVRNKYLSDEEIEWQKNAIES